MRFLILHPWLWTYPGRIVLDDWVAWPNLVVHVNFFMYSKLNIFCQEIILSWFCTCWYVKVSFIVWFNLNFNVLSNKWILGKWKGNYFLCLEFSFYACSYYTAFSLSSHSSVFCCKQGGKNYKFQKLHLTPWNEIMV